MRLNQDLVSSKDIPMGNAKVCGCQPATLVLRGGSKNVTLPGGQKIELGTAGKLGSGQGNFGRGGAEGRLPSRWKPLVNK